MEAELRQYLLYQLTHPVTVKIVLKTSLIHGLGLFADENIPAGTLVAYYPVIYSYNPKTCLFYSISDEEKTDDELRLMIDRYSMTGPKEYLFLGDPKEHGVHSTTCEPVEQTGAIGHLLNDGIDLSKMKKVAKAVKLRPRKATVIEFMQMYYKHSKSNVHHQHGEGGVHMVATRDIKAGEELLYSYDFHYWMNALVPDLPMAKHNELVDAVGEQLALH